MSPKLRGDDRGATAVEYALLSAFITAVIAVSAGLLGQQLDASFARAVAGF
jgi:Flp pilus assembly pilin Flp